MADFNKCPVCGGKVSNSRCSVCGAEYSPGKKNRLFSGMNSQKRDERDVINMILGSGDIKAKHYPKGAKCPVCGGVTVSGKCVICGHEIPEEVPAENKGKVDLRKHTQNSASAKMPKPRYPQKADPLISSGNVSANDIKDDTEEERKHIASSLFGNSAVDKRMLTMLLGDGDIKIRHFPKGLKCPECGGNTVSGRCVLCGYTFPDEEENAKKPVNTGIRRTASGKVDLRKYSDPAAGEDDKPIIEDIPEIPAIDIVRTERRCPLCGTVSYDSECPSCGYIIPGENELDYYTHVMNALPEDYPTAEPAKAEEDDKKKVSGDMFSDAYAEDSRVIPNVVPVHGSQLPAVQNNPAQNMPKTVGVFYQNQPQTPSPPPPQQQRKYTDFYDMINDYLGRFVLWFGSSLVSTSRDLSFSNLIVLALMFIPWQICAVLTGIFLLFSFGKRKSVAVMTAVMILLTLGKRWVEIYIGLF